MSEEWGPWIDHDGACPDDLIGLPNGTKVTVATYGGIDDLPTINHLSPPFYWRWREVKVGWFRVSRVRVCDDGVSNPIIRYRIRKPRGLVILETLLTDLPERVDA